MTNTKEVPVLFEKKEDCCGCGACQAICPVGAIAMEQDQDGFYYPQISPDPCLRCGQCLQVCPLKQQ